MRADQDVTSVLDGVDLDTLLKALAKGHGFKSALRDPPARRSWSDMPPTSLNFGEFDDRIDRLAGILATNHAQPGAVVAILAPLGRESIVSVLACLRAGLSPLMLPLHLSDDDLLRLIDLAEPVMALGVGRVGTLKPLVMLRDLAVRSFTMRFVGGFGGDIPDGVAPLDSLMANAVRHPIGPVPSRGQAQVLDGRRLGTPEVLSERIILSKALDISRIVKPLASSRIVTTLVGGDLAALASGPAMALLAGVEILPLGLFSAGELQACLAGGREVHLVAPGTMEPALAHSKVMGDRALASLIFVHRAGDAREEPAIDRPDLAIVDIDAVTASEITVSRRRA